MIVHWYLKLGKVCLSSIVDAISFSKEFSGKKDQNWRKDFQQTSTLLPELAFTVMTWYTNHCIPFYISAPNIEINFFIFCSTIVNIVFSFINISTLHIYKAKKFDAGTYRSKRCFNAEKIIGVKDVLMWKKIVQYREKRMVIIINNKQ